ncbi:MAG: hypothetical protein JKX73_05755 [Flavobacteriales bacterium]|nr:hypothetical protein [Flavobacteriales bacterium]
MFGEILKLAWWLFFVVFKFIWAPVTMAATTDYLWWEVLIITIAGAWIGIVIFFYFGKVILEYFNKRRKNPPKKFNKLNRFIAKVKGKYGLTGLVTIIGIISVPLCSLIAAAYFKENKRVVPALLLSTVIWACSLTAIVFFLLNNDG